MKRDMDATFSGCPPNFEIKGQAYAHADRSGPLYIPPESRIKVANLAGECGAPRGRPDFRAELAADRPG